ncbi:MAG: S8/S53 family peptidase [Nannocystaceae bacterium]
MSGNILTHRAPDDAIYSKLEDALAAGVIRTHDDFDFERSALIEEHNAGVLADKAAVLERLYELGAKDVASAKNSSAIAARMRRPALETLAGHPDVRKIFHDTPLADEHGSTLVRDAHQIFQFFDAGFTGDAVSGQSDITFAQIEGNGADNEHRGFRENSGSSDRIRGLFNCTGGSCSSTTNFSSSQEADHASSVAGVIFGDLTDDQDSSVTSSSAQADRSGMAAEARGYLIRAGFTNRDEAFDLVPTLSVVPAVVNVSAGAGESDCDGDQDLDEAANKLFEAGTLVIKSAGNDGHATSACTVTTPGSALGVFTVGGVGNDRTESSQSALRNADEYGPSSRGGARTMVDIAASACRELLFDDTGGYSRSACGTSYAAPTVTGTAIDFIDWYKVEYSDYIDNPGVLYVHLLLQGDRQTESGTYLATGYDQVVGSGHLRARRFDAVGLDGPWDYGRYSACVGHNTDVSIDISGGTLSSDVDTISAAIYWYDGRHHSSGTLDDIDLALMEGNTVLENSQSASDNKERVFHDDPGGRDLSLRIRGFNVTADDEGCGDNRMRVWFAWYYEDSDRESHENLDDVDPA